MARARPNRTGRADNGQAAIVRSQVAIDDRMDDWCHEADATLLPVLGGWAKITPSSKVAA